MWNNYKYKNVTCGGTSQCTKRLFSSPQISWQAAAHVMTHACFTWFCCTTDNMILKAEGISRSVECMCY